MKKLFPLLITALLLLSLIACGNNADNNEDDTILPPDYTDADDNATPDNQAITYLLKTYSTTDEYGNAGTYTEINGWYSAGTAVELEATVKSGYNFVGWFIDEICISEDLKCTFSMKSSNIEIEARYNYFTVLTSSDSNDYEKAGTYTELKNKKISVGELVTVEATVNAGYNFEGWFIGDVCVSEELAYSFVMKERDVYLEARWSYYTISVNSRSDNYGAAGTYPKKDYEKVSAGETVTLVATVADGYNFEGWYINGVCVSSELTYQFVMEKSNKSINAEYSYYTLTTYGYMNKYTYSYDTLTENVGTITKYDHKAISNSEKVTLIATLGDGYTFKGWFIGDTCVCKDLEYTYTMTKESVTIDALYTYYTVETGAFEFVGGYGDIEPDGRFPFVYNTNSYEDFMGTYTVYDKEPVRVGDTVTLVATTKEGYSFLGWKSGEVIISTSSTYTFVMGESDEFIEAVFSYIGE